MYLFIFFLLGMKYKVLIFGILVIAISTVVGCGQETLDQDVASSQSQENSSPIRLGWVGPLTGDVSSFGHDARVAAQMAVDEVNATGGIHGRQLELVAEDGKCAAKDATIAAQKLISIDGASVIIGGLCSGETSAIAPEAERQQVILFSYCSGASTITQAGEYVFRTYPSDAYQGVYAAEYVYTKLGKRRVATLAVLGDYGSSLKQAFEKRFQELGGEIVLSQDYKQHQVDFRLELTKIKASTAELVYAPGYAGATVPLLRQKTEMSVSLPFFAADTWEDKDIFSQSFANGVMYTYPTFTIQDQEWIKRMEERGAKATTCAPYAYTNVKMIADIMRRVGNIPTLIKDELYNVKDYQAIHATITIDKNGDPAVSDYTVKVIRNNEPVVVF